MYYNLPKWGSHTATSPSPTPDCRSHLYLSAVTSTYFRSVSFSSEIVADAFTFQCLTPELPFCAETYFIIGPTLSEGISSAYYSGSLFVNLSGN